VVVGLPEAAPMTLIEKSEEAERYYLGAANVSLHTMETANYRDNLASGMPKFWVVMRQDPVDQSLSLVAVTADPAEGEAHSQSEANLVDTAPMSAELASALAVFVEEHHVEREFYKRKRDRADLDGGRRTPGRERR
jgi:hypothetical protein